MADIPYGFEKSVAKTLLDIAKSPGQGGVDLSWNPEQRRVALAKATSDIAGGSDATPTTAQITLCKIDGTNGVVTTEVVDDAYNVVPNVVKANDNNFAIREYISGKWIVVPIAPVANYVIKTPGGGVPALSSDTPGTAEVTLYQIDGTNGLVSASITETGYNIDCTSIPGGVYAGAYRDGISGKLVVIAPPISDLRLDGNNLQYKKGCSWTTWTTGTDCP